MTASRFLVVVPDDLAPGFRVAGAAVRAATDPDAAAETVRDLIGGDERGVIAVYEPWFVAFPPALRVRLERSVSPVVVPLPSGLEAEGGEARRARLAELLQRAVGYHITFGEEQP